MGEKPFGRKLKMLSRIPPPRIKRILQTDEEIGKMANPVPAVIGRALEVFVEKLLTKSVDVTHQRFAKTLTPQHIKECVRQESAFQFLQPVVASVPDLAAENVYNSGCEASPSGSATVNKVFVDHGHSESRASSSTTGKRRRSQRSTEDIPSKQPRMRRTKQRSYVAESSASDDNEDQQPDSEYSAAEVDSHSEQ